MSRPLITVIIPCYNARDYVAQCLKSVTDQTISDLEIICIDDCSNDGTSGILLEYEKNDDRIKVIHTKEKCGPGLARNIGLKNSAGKYVSFADADDWLLPEKLEQELSVIERGGWPSVCSNYILSTDAEVGRADRVKRLPERDETVHIGVSTLSRMTPMLWNKLYSVHAIKAAGLQFGNGSFGEDLEFNFKFYRTYPDSCQINKALYVYRIHPKSITRNDAYKEIRGQELLQALDRCRMFLIDTSGEAYFPALFSIMESHLQQFLFSPESRDKTIDHAKALLLSMKFESCDTSTYPLLECIINYSEKKHIGFLRHPLLLLSKITPISKFRRKLRAWTKLNCQ
ncbi:MAG: glycosyltransferase [Planctomycetaceae bacterium]|nr:glycosyltransferase [Planctomycetaceae bacterium]